VVYGATFSFSRPALAGSPSRNVAKLWKLFVLVPRSAAEPASN
jgi:hypothetical protein